MFALLSTQKQRSTSLVNAHPTAIGRTSFDLDDWPMAVLYIGDMVPLAL
jgi:hypothetical protein